MAATNADVLCPHFGDTGAMSQPLTRVMAVLELLQTHGQLSGPELATRLAVNIRTVRRYMVTLQGMGVPIVSDLGRNGTYSLVGGFKLPPMMFTNDEAVVLTLGLSAARSLNIADADAAVSAALAKLERVMPVALRGHVRALSESAALARVAREDGAASELLALCSAASRECRRLELSYSSADGALTQRSVDPYGVAFLHDVWYAVGWCHLRAGLRSFRLDRIVNAKATDIQFERPASFDVRAYLTRAIATMPYTFACQIWCDARPDDLARLLPASVFLFEAVGDGTLLSANVNDLDWTARVLSQLHCRFEIRSPDALKSALTEHAHRLLSAC
jgi:predicted DNA-binding transcriptional regulator YafY